MSVLRPPLPPPLSHDGIEFVLGRSTSGHLPPEILVQIASAISAALPPGDFEVAPSGHLVFSQDGPSSRWFTAARLESIDRSAR